MYLVRILSFTVQTGLPVELEEDLLNFFGGGAYIALDLLFPFKEPAYSSYASNCIWIIFFYWWGNLGFSSKIARAKLYTFEDDRKN